MLQIRGNWQFVSVVDKINLAEEEKPVSAVAADEEEELQRTDLDRQMDDVASYPDRWMKAAADAAKIAERRMEEAAKEAESKAVATKATAAKATNFLSFLVRLCKYRCTLF